jgi:hypothetical protein
MARRDGSGFYRDRCRQGGAEPLLPATQQATGILDIVEPRRDRGQALEPGSPPC